MALTVCGIEYLLIGINQTIVIGYVYCPQKTATRANITSFLAAISTAVSEYVQKDKKNINTYWRFQF